MFVARLVDLFKGFVVAIGKNCGDNCVETIYIFFSFSLFIVLFYIYWGIRGCVSYHNMLQ